jgi:hypothetical protein
LAPKKVNKCNVNSTCIAFTWRDFTNHRTLWTAWHAPKKSIINKYQGITLNGKTVSIVAPRKREKKQERLEDIQAKSDTVRYMNVSVTKKKDLAKKEA